jgi:hypothetical protein
MTGKDDIELLRAQMENAKLNERLLILENKRLTGQVSQLQENFVLKKAKNQDQIVYIIQELQEDNIFKVGSSKRVVTRSKAYKTHSNHSIVVYTKSCTNRHLLENLVHHILKEYAYNNRKDWFNVKFEVVKNAIDEAQKIVDCKMSEESDDDEDDDEEEDEDEDEDDDEDEDEEIDPKERELEQRERELEQREREQREREQTLQREEKEREQKKQKELREQKLLQQQKLQREQMERQVKREQRERREQMKQQEQMEEMEEMERKERDKEYVSHLYTCIRCNYKTKDKFKMRRHFDRQNVCPGTLNDLVLTDFIKEKILENRIYQYQTVQQPKRPVGPVVVNNYYL